MSLVRIDWNPTTRKLREFGALLIAFSLGLGGLMLWRHKAGGPAVMGAGGALGLVALALPAAGIYVYKAWMGFAFVMGTITSFFLLGVVYYAILTPLGLLFRVRGRDALRLKARGDATYWVPTRSPDDKSYYERLF